MYVGDVNFQKKLEIQIPFLIFLKQLLGKCRFDYKVKCVHDGMFKN